VHPATAVGTDLLYAAVTKGVGTLVHGAHGTVDWRITRRLAAGSVPATIATLTAMHYAGWGQQGTGRVIDVILGVALLLTAVALLLRSRITAFAVSQLEGNRHVVGLTVFTGAVLGVLVSISSVGAGALGVTALILLYPRTSTVTIVGSDIAHAVPLTLVAGIGHWIIGSVSWPMLASLLCGSIPGIIAGSLLSMRMPEKVLRPVLATVLVVVGGRLVM
jgi:uncharacterized membrane protein YfcA